MLDSVLPYVFQPLETQADNLGREGSIAEIFSRDHQECLSFPTTELWPCCIADIAELTIPSRRTWWESSGRTAERSPRCHDRTQREVAGASEEISTAAAMAFDTPRHFLRPRSDLCGIQKGVYFQPPDGQRPNSGNSNLRRDPWIRKNLIEGDS